MQFAVMQFASVQSEAILLWTAASRLFGYRPRPLRQGGGASRGYAMAAFEKLSYLSAIQLPILLELIF